MGCAYDERTVYSLNTLKFDLYLEQGTSKKQTDYATTHQFDAYRKVF